jgi:hypothetical protein
MSSKGELLYQLRRWIWRLINKMEKDQELKKKKRKQA